MFSELQICMHALIFLNVQIICKELRLYSYLFYSFPEGIEALLAEGSESSRYGGCIWNNIKGSPSMDHGYRHHLRSITYSYEKLNFTRPNDLHMVED